MGVPRPSSLLPATRISSELGPSFHSPSSSAETARSSSNPKGKGRSRERDRNRQGTASALELFAATCSASLLTDFLLQTVQARNQGEGKLMTAWSLTLAACR